MALGNDEHSISTKPVHAHDPSYSEYFLIVPRDGFNDAHCVTVSWVVLPTACVSSMDEQLCLRQTRCVEGLDPRLSVDSCGHSSGLCWAFRSLFSVVGCPQRKQVRRKVRPVLPRYENSGSSDPSEAVADKAGSPLLIPSCYQAVWVVAEQAHHEDESHHP